MTTVDAIRSGHFIEQYLQLEAHTNTLNGRVQAVFQQVIAENQHSSQPEPTSLQDAFAQDLSELAYETREFLGSVWSWWKTPEPPTAEEAVRQDYRAVQQILGDIHELRVHSPRTDYLFQNLKEIRLEIDQDYRDKTLSPEQMLYVEQRFQEMLQGFQLIAERHLELNAVLSKYEGPDLTAGLQLLHRTIHKSLDDSIRREDTVRAEQLSDQALLANFQRIGAPIIALLRQEENSALFTAPQLEHLYFLLTAVERRENLTTEQVRTLLEGMQAIADRKYRMQKLKEDLKIRVVDVLHQQPTLTKTVANVLAFGVGFLLGGLPLAISSRMAVGQYVDNALGDHAKQQSQEGKVAEAVVEGITSAVIAGPGGVVGSVATSALQVAPQPVQDVATTGSLAFLAHLAGISPYSAAQVGFLGTLAIKRQGLVKEVLQDCRHFLHLLRNPREVPGALLREIGRWVKGLHRSLQTQNWKEFGVRAGALLSAPLAWLLGLTSFFTAGVSMLAGQYLLTKFFKPMKRYEGAPSLDNPSFLACVTTEYNCLRHRTDNGIATLKRVVSAEMPEEQDKVDQLFEQYDDLYERVRTQVNGIQLRERD